VLTRESEGGDDDNMPLHIYTHLHVYMYTSQIETVTSTLIYCTEKKRERKNLSCFNLEGSRSKEEEKLDEVEVDGKRMTSKRVSVFEWQLRGRN
jgi:hypothetical protein